MVAIQVFEVRRKEVGTLILPHEKCDCEEVAVDCFYELLKDLPHEEVWVLCVNAKGVIVSAVKIAQGGLSGTTLNAADVFRPVILSGAVCFILGHNHPSGDPEPSDDDMNMTRYLEKAGEAIGLKMVDHLVVCPEKKLFRSCIHRL